MSKNRSPKQQPQLKVDYAVLCEDIRMENNNKVMLAGIYTGSILVAEFPATLRIGVWFHCEAAQPGTYDIEAKIEAGGAGPNKEKPTVISGKLPFVVNRDPHGFEAAFGMGGAIFKVQGPGPFRVFYRLAGETRWKKVIDKNVNLLTTVRRQPSERSLPDAS